MKGIKLGIRALALMVFCFFAATSGCQPPELKKVEPVVEPTVEPVVEPVVKPPAVQLPVERSITDKQGRKVSVVILGKSEDSIKFRRTSDGKEYALPIASLSAGDQEFLKGVDDKEFTIDSTEPVSRTTATRIAAIEKKLKRVRENIAHLQAKISDPSLRSTSTKLRGYKRDLVQNQSMEIELTLELERVNGK